MRKRMINFSLGIVIAVVTLVSCSKPPQVMRLSVKPVAPATTSTTTTTTTINVSHSSPVAATRSYNRFQSPANKPVPDNGDFWRRLANCENATGNAPGGYFQFMGTTRAAVGWAPGQSYETQLAEAKNWAARIHPREGTSAGWPRCWWVASA